MPALETLSSLGFEERNPGCPGNFAGMSRTPGGVQKVCAKKLRAHFSFPIDSFPRMLLNRSGMDCPLGEVPEGRARVGSTAQTLEHRTLLVLSKVGRGEKAPTPTPKHINNPDAPILAFFVFRFSLFFCTFLFPFQGFWRVRRREKPLLFRSLPGHFLPKKSKDWRVRENFATRAVPRQSCKCFFVYVFFFP